MCFPPSLIAVKTVSVMSEAQFPSTLMSKGTGYSYLLVAKNAVSTTAGIMQFAPIPAYSVYDAFEQDLNTALVLERVMRDSSVASNMMTHLKYFLRACLSSHNASDNKPHIGGTV